MKKIVILFLSLFLLPQTALAYYNPGQPSGFVNDYAKVLDQSTVANLENELKQFEVDTKHEITVVIVPSLQGDTIENFAVKLFEDWKIGKSGADNGILFLVAMQDRKVRIEVGYGLEGALPDAVANNIIKQITNYYFKLGDYNKGVTETVKMIESVIKNEDVSANLRPGTKTFQQKFDQYGYFIFFVVFAMLRVFAAFFGKSKRWWPGGVWGAVLGIFFGFFALGLTIHIIWFALFVGLFGLAVDYAVSKGGGKRPGGFWGGWGGGLGGGGLGGGGFGGFGGGRSGGGGSSGGW